MKRSAASFVSALLLAGCAGALGSKPVHVMTVEFDQAQAERQLQRGVATVRGNAFMRQQGGGVVTCAGSPVYLVPATAYARERFQTLFGSTDAGTNPFRNYDFQPSPFAYTSLVKETVCDSQGNFTFDNVADGEFFATTIVRWQIGYNVQGGFVMRRLVIREGQPVSVVLSG